MAKYRDVEKTVAKLRANAEGMLLLADFLEKRGVQLPDTPTVDPNPIFSVWLTELDYSLNNETGKYESKLNMLQTTANVFKFVKGLGSCEKQYDDDQIEIKKKFGTVTLEGNVRRELVCEKKVLKREWIPPHQMDGYYKEETIWECSQPSLLGLVKDG